MTRISQASTALFLSAALLAAACLGTARADGKPTVANPDADAGRLVDEVLRRAGGNGGDSLGAWSRSVIDRALERAGESARQTVPGSTGTTAAPLPAERHAAGIAASATGRAGTAEILIFISLSVPAQSWRQWARDAAALGAAEHAGPPLVLRGVVKGGLRETAKRIGERLGGHDVGVAIDPRLFRLFDIERVPAVVVVPGGGPGRSPARVSPVPPCRSRGCLDDPPPPHDLVTGNIGIVAALEAIAAEGDVGRDVAKAHLERMRGDGR